MGVFELVALVEVWETGRRVYFSARIPLVHDETFPFTEVNVNECLTLRSLGLSTARAYRYSCANLLPMFLSLIR